MNKSIFFFAITSMLTVGCASLDVNNESRKDLFLSISKIKISNVDCHSSPLRSTRGLEVLWSKDKTVYLSQDTLNSCLNYFYSQIDWHPDFLNYQRNGFDSDVKRERAELLALKKEVANELYKINKIFDEAGLIYANSGNLSIDQIRDAKRRVDEKLNETRPVSNNLREILKRLPYGDLQPGSTVDGGRESVNVNSFNVNKNNKGDILRLKIKLSQDLKVYHSSRSLEEAKYWDYIGLEYGRIYGEYLDIATEVNSNFRNFSKFALREKISDDLASLEMALEEQNKREADLEEKNQVLHNEKAAKKLGLKGYYNDFMLDLESGRMPLKSVGFMVQVLDGSGYEAAQSFGKKGLFETRSGRIPLVVTFPKVGYVAEGEPLESTFYRVLSISPYKTISGALRNAVFLEYLGD